MAHIVLTEEQARVVSQSPQGVEVRDPQGHPVAFFDALSAEEARVIAEARRRAQVKGPRIPAARVRDMMTQLQLLHETGEATPERIRAIVRAVVAEGSQ